ncbi:hypothetical protein GYMLUDRAFT_345251 [Collybiopsis luxurians FD-317 M1]|nr:hypothetical protein GYMLUDRAFT_345251 [Collybiopsis luxurians FD-317 M1]
MQRIRSLSQQDCQLKESPWGLLQLLEILILSIFSVSISTVQVLSMMMDAFDRLGRTARRFHNSSRANQNASTAAPTDQSSIHLPFSFFGPAVAPASNQQSPGIRREANVRENNNGPPGQPPDISSYISSMLGAAGMNGARRSQPIRSGAHHPRRSARGSTDGPRERRQWAPPPPPPPGLTLRQTIEKREREAGLRCWDVSCGVGPSDEDPFVTISEEQKRQVKIRRISTVDQQGVESKGKGKEKAEEEPEPQYVCEHSFHPSCLVSAQRAALNGSEEVPVGNGKSVEVSCTVCRAIGALPREDWEEGVRALGA